VDAPPDYGPRKTLDNHFVRWTDKCLWVGLIDAQARSGARILRLMIDSLAVKAHRSAVGGKGKKNQALVPVEAERPKLTR
jgi:hypothetical protein